MKYNYYNSNPLNTLRGAISKVLFLLLAFSFVIIKTNAQTDNYTGTTAANVQNTWTVPCGVTQVTIRMWGGGGGSAGCRSTNTANTRNRGSGAGGGGAFSYAVVTVTPGDVLYIQAGRGGAAGAAANGNGGAGGPSWVRITSQAGTIRCGANGGDFGRGTANNTTAGAGGAGGANTGGVATGDVHTAGGNGGTGITNNGRTAAGGGSGGAGGTGGTGPQCGNGGAAGAAGALNIPGYAGADGRSACNNSTSNDGRAGGATNWGAGAAGPSAGGSSQVRAGALGSPGRVEITYTIVPLAAPQAVANISAGPVVGVNGTPLLPDANITASSCYLGCAPGGAHEPWRGRLFNPGPGTQGWASNSLAYGSEYLQFDLGSNKNVFGVATQGRGDCCPQWVTTYTVEYSTDGASWTQVPGTFTGNTNQQTAVTNTFTPVLTRYIRVIPQSVDGYMTMRADVLVLPCEGNTVNLSAEVPANANTVRWYNAASGGTLLHTGQYFTTPSLNTNTTYYAEAFNSVTGCFSASRTAVTAQVNPLPVITTQPTNQVTCGDDPVSFDIATSAPSPTYNWQYFEPSIPGWVDLSTLEPLYGISGSLTSQLDIDDPKTNGWGGTWQVRCLVTSSDCQTTSNVATITVNDFPSLTSVVPDPAATCEGYDVTVTLNGMLPSVNPSTVTYSIGLTTGLTATVSNVNGSGVGSFVITPTAAQSGATIEVTNISRTDVTPNCPTTFSISGTLPTVTPSPVITSQPSALTLCENGSGSFTAAASGSPTYQWYYSNTGLPGSWIITDAVGGLSGHTSGTLSLSSIPVSYNGFFVRCEATENGCTTPTNSVLLSVRATPTASIGGTTTVCQGVASPDITFTNGVALPVTVTYNVNGGSNTTVAIGAGIGATATVPQVTTAFGTFVYNLVSVAYTDNIPSGGCSNGLSGSATVTVLDNTAPTNDEATVSSLCWEPNGSNTYTITIKSSAASGLGGSTYGMMALINYQGDNASNNGPNNGGYFAWNTSLALLNAIPFAKDQMACTGGGFVAMYGLGYGNTACDLISAETSVSGNQRTVTFTVRPTVTFPSLVLNDVSVYSMNSCGVASGWVNFDINFNSVVAAQPSAIVGALNPEIGTSQVYSVTNVPGLTYTWAFPASWNITAGQGTNSVTVTVGGTNGTISVTPSNICGAVGTARTATTTIPNYRAIFVSANFGASTWCSSTSRTVTVTIKNNGVSTWTDSGPDVNVGVRWSGWADHFVRTDALNLAPGATQTYSLVIEAKNATAGPTYGSNLAAGANNLFFDVVAEGCFWFRSNATGGSCTGVTVGGNAEYNPGAITIIDASVVSPISGASDVCVGSTTPFSSTPTATSYTISPYTSSGTFTAPRNLPAATTSVLVVAGGGGGGANGGGGGGGGGVVSNANFAISSGANAVTVGAGGTGSANPNAPGSNGGNSIFSSITAVGGGGGASRDGGAGGQLGGSGGGGGGTALSNTIQQTASGSGGTSESNTYGGAGNTDINITFPALPTGAVVATTAVTITYTANGASFRSELRVQINPPAAVGGQQNNITPAGAPASAGTLTNAAIGTYGTGNPAGSWNFKFRESTNDGVPNPDANITNITITVNYTVRHLAGLGTSGQGSNGGNGTAPDAGCNAAGGGGGGAGGGGSAASSTVGGNGGAGVSNSISGAALLYGGGGGGGRTCTNATLGTGGSGGGGNGGGSTTASLSGTNGRGGGGGGSGQAGGTNNGGSGIVIIKWIDGEWTSDNPAVAMVDPATGVVTGISAGTTNINYTVRLNGACPITVSRAITVNPIPTAAISPATATVCSGSPQILTASGGGTYAWSNSGGTDADATFSPTSSTTYTVTVTNNGCTATESRTIRVPSNVSVPALTGDQTICENGGTTQFTVPFTDPTGGTITTVGSDYRVHTFTANDNFETVQPLSAEILVVGGGGSGGPAIGGGGGGGAVVYVPRGTVANATYPIVIGAGGVSTTANGASGGSSTAFGMTAFGGGSSGRHDVANGTNGGSGGGAGSNNAVLNTGGSAVPGSSSLGSFTGRIFGNSGGSMLVARLGGPTRAAGGGGAGAPALSVNSNFVGAGISNGGNGVQIDIDGTAHFWAGGGGGGAFFNGTAGNGGLGGGGGGAEQSGSVGVGGGSALNTGGDGGTLGDDGPGGNGGANTGGGGGGGTWDDGLGGTGGSGVVIVRYPIVTNGVWESSNTGVATVNSSGLVSAVGPGTATIRYHVILEGCTTTVTRDVTVRPTPTASISGTTTVCQDGAEPDLTFTNPMTLPVTVTYTINGGSNQTVNVGASTTSNVPAPTGTAGDFVYSLVSVAYQSTPNCTNSISGSATITVRPTPTASISGTTTVCQDGASPDVTFTNPMALAVTVIYSVNGGGNQTVNIGANTTATVAQPTVAAGDFVYSLESVAYQTTPNCDNMISGDATVTVRATPSLTGSVQEPAYCDGVANTVTLSGLAPSSVFNVGYTVSGGGQQSSTATLSNSSGVATFQTIPLTMADNGQILQVNSLEYSTAPACAVNSFTQDLTILIRNAANNVNLATATASAALIQCSDGPWTYYADNTYGTDKWIFAIDKSGNTFEAEVTITKIPEVSPGVPGVISHLYSNILGFEHGSYLLGRYWNVRMISGSINPAQPVRLRFYFDPAEKAAAEAERDAVAAFYSTLTSPNRVLTPFKWFKTVGVPFDPNQIIGNDFSAFNNIELIEDATGQENGVDYVQFNTITSFSGGGGGFGFGNQGVGLPVNMLYFTATAVKNSYIELKWATATETDNQGFEVQRSTDGVNFTKIGWVDGNGNSTSTKTYKFDDKNVDADVVYYYRLMQIDFDADFEYSNIASASIKGDNSVDVLGMYPNPTTGRVVIEVVLPNQQDVKVSLTDMLGRTMSDEAVTVSKGYSNIELDYSEVAAGTYTVSITSGTQVITKKLIISR